MDSDTKLKILSRLSQTQSAKALETIQREFGKSRRALEEETGFVSLNDVLAELSVYAHRVPSESVEVIAGFLDRLRRSNFVELDPEFSYYDNGEAISALASDAIKILEHIRYLELPEVLTTLLAACRCEAKSIRDTAIEALRKCASYDLDVFYANDDHGGIGFRPQFDILKFLEENLQQCNSEEVEPLLVLADGLLSPTIRGQTWNYQTVTWKEGAVPATDDLAFLRSRTLEILIQSYEVGLPESTRSRLLSTGFSASEFPRNGCTRELQDIVEADTLRLFDWISEIVVRESYPMIQKIERDTYWKFYHASSNAVRASALKIRDKISTNSEYAIYRDLIGFEGIFDEWEDSVGNSRSFELAEENRRAKVEQYVGEITEETWLVWRARIHKFCETKSNDLATFPVFYDFLNKLAISNPKLAFQLVNEDLDVVERFTVPIFRGLLSGPMSKDLSNLFVELTENGNQLSAITRAFIGSETIDETVLSAVLKSACQQADEFALSDLIVLAGTLHKKTPEYSVKRLFIPSIEALLERGNTSWIENTWYSRHVLKLVQSLGEEEILVFLESLESVKNITYEVEELLAAVATRHLGKVIDFFLRRIERSKTQRDLSAIPFSFHILSKPMAQEPVVLVERIKEWKQHADSMFQFGGGRLIAISFPEFGEGLEAALRPLAESGDRLDAKFVLGVLRNYQGEKFVHNICRSLVTTHHVSEALMDELMIALQSTGVVVGEMGLAEAYAAKAEELRYWLHDDDARVRDFARRYIERVGHYEQVERERAQELIELRKHRFGEAASSP